jgi:prepilin-type N-terminal cleavage/methylation domain-containing protein
MRSTHGFTIVEVLVAIMILTTGVLSVAAGSGSVFRMLASGRRSTVAAAVAQARLESLRRDANRTNPRCTALAAGTAIQRGVTERWLITGTGTSRRIIEIVTVPRTRGLSTDSVFAIIECL